MPISKDLKSVGSNLVRVRIPPSAPITSITYKQSSFALQHTQRSYLRCAAYFGWICEAKSHHTRDHLAPSAVLPQPNQLSIVFKSAIGNESRPAHQSVYQLQLHFYYSSRVH